jgi:xanthine permease
MKSLSDSSSAEALVAEPASGLTYGLEERPPLGSSLIFGLQHVLVMFSPMIGEPFIIGAILGLPPGVVAIMLAATMLGCGVGTLLQTQRLGFIGSGLPIVMGSFYIFIPPIVAIAMVYPNREQGLGAAFTAIFIGGLVMVLLSPLYARLRAVFPPLVTGTVVTIIGLSLIPIALGQSVGLNTPLAKTPQALILSTVTLLAIIVLNRFTRGFVQTISILLGLAIGCALAAMLGLFDLTNVAQAPWLGLPAPLPFGFAVPDPVAIGIVILSFIVAGMECTGATLATAKVVGVNPEERHIRGSVAADGAASAFAALFGGSPQTTYSSNTGLISLTGVGSRFVVGLGGLMLIVLGFLPKFAGLIAAIPGPVLGGALVVTFGMVAAIGVTIVRDALNTDRDLLIFATSVALGLGLTTLPQDALEFLPQSLRIVLSSGMTVGAFCAVLMNLLIPRPAAPPAHQEPRPGHA